MNRGSIRDPFSRKEENVVLYKTLFSPFKIRGLELKNRVIMPGMNTKMASNGVSDQLIAYHVTRAKGGCALNFFEATTVHPRAQTNVYMGLYNTEQRDDLKRLTSAVHEVGGKIGIQLFHSGFVCEPFLVTGMPPMTTKNMTEADVEEVMISFGNAARLAVEAGFDTMEFHCAHSYLPHEFLSGGMNKRTDKYGGSLENRASFALGCIREIRKNIPEDMPLFMRVDAQDDFLEGGLTTNDVIRFVNWAADAGVDIVNVSRGNVLTLAAAYEVPPINFERGWNLDLIAKIKAGVSIPVVAVGRIVDPEMAEKTLNDGIGDLIAIGRGQIADPEWCNKSQRGESGTIAKCVGCLQGCYDAVLDPTRTCISCLQNPMVSHEHETILPARTPKRVMIASQEAINKAMSKQKGGCIINIASVAGITPDTSQIAYGTSKAAIIHLSKVIATHAAKDNITCNVVCPGMTATEAVTNNLTPEFMQFFLKHTPIARMAEPQEMADAALYFATASFTTGQVMAVHGGFGLPSPVYGDMLMMTNKR